MKLLILVPSLGGGGAEFVAREWARWLHGRSIDVRLIVTGTVTQDECPPGVPLYQISGGGFLHRVLELRKYVRLNEIDVVLSLMPYFNLLALISRLMTPSARTKVVISGRNVEVPLRQVFGWKFRVIQLVSKVFYPMADAYVAISHTVAAEAAALYRIRPSRISVVPNPATAKVKCAISAGESAPGLTLDPDSRNSRLNIVVPARLVEQKRPQIPILVAAELADQFSEVEVHYFGSGPLESEIRDLAANNSVRVVFHGWVENWFEKCPSDSVVLLASLAEGFGNVLIEAASAGIASVVSSRCLGSSDAIVPGLTGQICAGDSVSDYVHAVLAASKIVLNGSEKPWLERFSPDSSGEILHKVLRDVYARQ